MDTEAKADGPETKRTRTKKRRRKRMSRAGDAAPANAAAAAVQADSGRSASGKRPRRVTRRPHRKLAAEDGAHVKAGPDQGQREQAKRRRAHKPTAAAGRNAVEDGLPYAALDLGTNNCRLLMAMPQLPGRFRVVDAFSRIVRLGEGLGASGRLSEAAMDRAVEALAACAAKLADRPVRGLRLIATEACRQAENGETFLRRVRDEVGLKLETIDRETEARLAVAGCSSLVDPETKGVVLFDIGGGSSELALLDMKRARKTRAGLADYSDAIAKWTSLPVGVVTLSERHGGGRNVTPAVFADMVDEVSFMLDAFDDGDVLGQAIADREVHLLGTSGTVTTLAGIHLGLPRYDRRRVDGTWMSVKQMTRIVTELSEMDYEQRIQNPCVGKDRADLVLAGCAILMAIDRRWPCERLRVADRGLREGLLTQMMDADDAWLPVHAGGR